jgi:uncharacterized membrane protein YeaQ/YmgE (transglycosylase-associated protein family)
MDRLRDPALSIVLVMVVGAVCGAIAEGLLNRGANARTRQLLTYALVGIAGAFLGFHGAMLAGLGVMQPIVPFLITAVVASLVLLGWNATRGPAASDR